MIEEVHFDPFGPSSAPAWAPKSSILDFRAREAGLRLALFRGGNLGPTGVRHEIETIPHRSRTPLTRQHYGGGDPYGA